MENILSVDEIDAATKSGFATTPDVAFARAIESAVLAKLREQQGPLCHVFNNYGQWSVVAEDAGNPSVIPVFPHPAPSAPEWQPIETAPKTGRELILLLTPSNWPQVAYSNTWWSAGFSVENKPTHWMKLPQPPQPPMAAARSERCS